MIHILNYTPGAGGSRQLAGYLETRDAALKCCIVKKSMNKRELNLSHPLVNLPGFLGFSPSSHCLERIRGLEDWGGFGAFITDPLSWRSRSLADDSGLQEADGQVIIHTGFPNRGFRAALKVLESKWARSPLPIIPSLMEADLQLSLEMVRELETRENIAAVNLMPPIDDLSEIQAWLAALPDFGAELPLIFSLSADLILIWGKIFQSAGVTAFLPAATRGTLQRQGKPFSGRLYGAPQYSAARRLAWDCSRRGIALIAAGGVDSREKVEELAEEHPLAIAIDLPLWRG